MPELIEKLPFMKDADFHVIIAIDFLPETCINYFQKENYAFNISEL